MGTTQGHCEVCGEGLGFPDAFRHGDVRHCIARLKREVDRLKADRAYWRREHDLVATLYLNRQREEDG